MERLLRRCALAAMTAAMALGLAGCATVKVQKIVPDGANPAGKADGPNGLRFYLPRPYVSVHEPFIVASKTYVLPGELTVDSKYVRILSVPKELENKFLVAPRDQRLLLRADSVPAAPTDGSRMGALQAEKAGTSEKPSEEPKGTDKPKPTGGKSTLKMTNDNVAFAVTPQRRYFDITWLPDFDEQYVAQVESRFGIASMTVNMGQGWNLQGLDASVDNSAIVGPLLEFYRGSVEALQKLTVAKIQGPLAAISGTVQADTKGLTAKDAFVAGTPLSLKVTVVRVVAPGLYPILKPTELEVAQGESAKAAIKAAEDRILAPVAPLTNIAFNTYEVVVIEGAHPTGDSALRISQYVDSGAPQTPRGSAGAGAGSGAATSEFTKLETALNERLKGMKFSGTQTHYEARVARVDEKVMVSLNKVGGDTVDDAFKQRVLKAAKEIAIAQGTPLTDDRFVIN